MSRASTEDPIKVFRFRVEIDGFSRAGFSEVTGLSKETEVVEYREGGDNETPQKSAGLTKYGDITLKRGLIVGSQRGGDNDVQSWTDQVHSVAAAGNGENYRRDLDIVQYNSLNQEVRRWSITNAWPSKVTPTGNLVGTSSENAIEEIVLAHEGYSISNSNT